jgi:tetratricopeptide (TPR) repeat protein
MHNFLLKITVLLLCLVCFAGQVHSQNLSKDSLTAILLADFASYRGEYHQALGYYQQQAKQLKSAELADTATQLAFYLKDYPAMLDNALLWQQYSEASGVSLFYSALAYGYNQHSNHAISAMQEAEQKQHATDYTRLVTLAEDKPAVLSRYQQLLKPLSKKQKNNADIYLALAHIDKAQGNSKTAIKNTQKALKKSQYQLIYVELALELLTELEAYQAAQSTYSKALQQHPDNEVLRQRYALFLTDKQPEAAKQQLLILQSQDTENGDYIFHLALVELELNNVKAAKTLLEQLLAMRQKQSSAHYYLALIAQYENNNMLAIEHFEQITKAHEKQKIAVALTQAYLQQQQLDKALATAENALYNPLDTEQQQMLLILQANIYHLSGKAEKAQNILDSLSANNSSYENDILYSKAMLYQQMGKLSSMEADLQQILQNNPNNAAALNALGFTLADNSIRLNEALQLIEKAHQLKPEDPAVLDSLGWVLYRLGRFDEAITYLQLAIDQFPDGEVAAHLGEVLWVTGKHRDAEAIFIEALNREPEHRILNETIKRLAIPLR